MAIITLKQSILILLTLTFICTQRGLGQTKSIKLEIHSEKSTTFRLELMGADTSQINVSTTSVIKVPTAEDSNYKVFISDGRSGITIDSIRADIDSIKVQLKDRMDTCHYQVNRIHQAIANSTNCNEGQTCKSIVQVKIGNRTIPVTHDGQTLMYGSRMKPSQMKRNRR